MGSRQWCYLVAVNLFFNNEVRALKLSIEPLANTDAVGIKETISASFSRFGISNFCSRLVASNNDRASVYMGIHRGLRKLIKVDAPWLSLIHCFNY